MSGLGPLPDGGRVVIIGGGPGGVACALLLHRRAQEAGRSLQITILEGKQFSGAHHHNLCVGVLAPPLPALLSECLDVCFPADLPHRQIAGYILHSNRSSLVLDDVHEPSVALRRIEFDDYMLEIARERGIGVFRGRAVDMDFHADRVMVYTENVPLEADVVVGAFGMDEGTAAVFARTTGYRPPQTMCSVVTRFHPGPAGMATFGSHIHAFLPADPGIEFGAVTPKDDHLTINIAGKSVTDEMMRAFLSRPEVRGVLPCFEGDGTADPADLQVFKGRFPASLAHRYYGDRFVLIGDAAGLVRAFKGKGVTSAVLTGMRAADTIFETGVSEHAFTDDYVVANRDITGDLLYGQGMRLMVRLATRMGLLDPMLRAARQTPALQEAFFGAVSAHLPYREVLGSMLRPGSVRAVLAAMSGR
jgi:flavin-dependent dehydrogenase